MLITVNQVKSKSDFFIFFYFSQFNQLITKFRDKHRLFISEAKSEKPDIPFTHHAKNNILFPLKKDS